MNLLRLLMKKDAARSGMGGVQAFERFYRCEDCKYVWAGPCPSPCRRCHSTNVTWCSEEYYEQHRND